jgi:hypothetical protein
MLASGNAWAQLPACYAGFEISRECLSRRGLEQKAAAYQRKIEEAMPKLGASYKVSLRLVNHPVEAGYDATAGDVFTEVVRNEEMRNEAFIINVTTDFLEKQPEILFEASSLHEICHVMNDDLTGYHRNGANIEAAEEHCVLQATGEARYEEYLQAYARYQHWDSSTYERTLQKVKDVVLVGAPRERDEADAAAAEYFRRHADGREHLVIYNGELHEVSELQRVIRAGRPMIFFHNHPAGEGTSALFPKGEDFGAAARFSFQAYREDPKLTVEFRVMQTGNARGSVSYGLKGAALDGVQRAAAEYRAAVARKADSASVAMRQERVDRELARESFDSYLRFACPAAACRTQPQYFTWPSDRFFIHYRPQ